MEQRFAHHPLGYLTTTGRVTGRPHTIEIWFADAGDTLYILSGGGDRADWVRNIMANGEATMRIDGHDHTGRGRVVTHTDEQRVARDIVFAKYQPGYGGDLTGWRERSLPMAIDVAAFDNTPSGRATTQRE